MKMYFRVNFIFIIGSVILMITLWIYTSYVGEDKYKKENMQLAYNCSKEVAECWDSVQETENCTKNESPIPEHLAYQEGCRNHLFIRSFVYILMASICWAIIIKLFMLWWLTATVWVALIAAEEGALVSPEEQGLRAGVWGPGPALLETSDPSTEPSPEDLNATELASKLGSALDFHFMSVDEPSEGLQAVDTSQFNFKRRKNGRLVPVGPMPQYVREVELGVVKLADGSRLKTQVPVRLKRKLRQLLWALTACPVGFRWRDLGTRFWPRWVREGLCPRSSCSVPAGMKCRPLAAQHKTLLRWHCRPPVCQWIKIQYPVVVQCSCACSSRSPH